MLRRCMMAGGGGGGSISYDTLVSAAAPTIWYKLEETSGTSAADSGSAGVNGTFGGSTFGAAGIVAAAGLAGVGRGVDLATSGAAYISNSSLNAAAMNALGDGGTSATWTVSMVVAGGSGSCYLASRVNQFAIIHNFVSGKVEFFALGYTGSDPRTGSQIDLSASDASTPHQIVYRYDNGNWSGLLDGVEVFNVTRSFGLADSTTTLYVGSDGASSHADRKFYDFQAYSRAVSTADLAAMWAARNIT